MRPPSRFIPHRNAPLAPRSSPADMRPRPVPPNTASQPRTAQVALDSAERLIQLIIQEEQAQQASVERSEMLTGYLQHVSWLRGLQVEGTCNMRAGCGGCK
eukprot:212362-Chlamydomonas_euryale.AAC.1